MQTNGYSLVQDKARAGMKYDAGSDYVESRPAGEPIDFGLGLKYDNGKVEVIDGSGDTFTGVALATHRIPQGLDQDADMGSEYTTGANYRTGDSVNVLRTGRVWVEVNASVAAEADAYVDTSDGKFTDDSTDNVSTGGKFRTDADAGELAVLDISLP